MATWKITWLFNAGRFGWSESWYFTGGFTAAFDAGKAVGNPRSEMLGDGASLEAMRVSDVAIFGDSAVTPGGTFLNPPGSIPLPNMDTPWNAILARANATTQYRRQVWFRGVPDDWIQFGGPAIAPLINPGFVAAFNAFKAALLASNFQLRAWSKDPGVTLPKAIKSIGQSAGNPYVEFFSPNHGLVQGQRIKIVGMAPSVLKYLNGPTTVSKVVDVDNWSIAKTFPTIQNASLYTGQAFALQQVYAYFTATDLQFERFAKKSTGRAFFVSRGRRSAKKS